MRTRAIILASALITVPFGAKAADLVIWWDEPWYTEEKEALAEVVAAFEQETGKAVEVDFYPIEELPGKIAAALEAGRPPDFAYGLDVVFRIPEWAFEDRLVDLTDTLGYFSNMFDADALAGVTLVNRRTGQKGLYGLPVGRSTVHIHVWKSLLKAAGFTLEDMPRDWEAFWSFWCDRVQPAVREATGRHDIWGVGLSMSPATAEPLIVFSQFRSAYGADYVTSDGRLLLDEPEVRQALVRAIARYAGIYLKGCTPPDSVGWGYAGNNEAFYDGAVVMTPNETLSIPNGLRQDRPDDYYDNTATIEWPLSPRSDAFPIKGFVYSAVVFKDSANHDTAQDFVRFLVAEGWLAHYLNFSAERVMPPIQALINQPFWLDPSDPHRMAAVMQVAERPTLYNYAAASGNWKHELVDAEFVWPKAIHSVAAGDATPEQAVDEAIARIKQILSE